MPLSGFLILLIGLLSVSPAAASHKAPEPRPVTQDMVLIPSGTFLRGCDRFGPEHGAPAHRVYLNSYMIDKFEITNKRYEEIFPEHAYRRSLFSDCDECPVSKVTWYDAMDYCYLIGKALPSEAQWEKAAGADNGCEFPWGPEFDPQKKQARGGLKLKDKAAPVGSYLPNKYGLYDMAGNMWEWVTDWFSIDYYFKAVMYNPRGPLHGIMKVRRGGSWSDSVKAMATGYRDWSYPFSRSLNDVGFRCVINFKPR